MKEKHSREIWPNFFIVGAIRAATKSLYNYLGAHPSVYMCPIKEPSFFSDNGIDRIGDKEKYLKLFDGVTDETAIGEATPHYLPDPTTPKRIHDIIPNARIIMMLRDPVERLFSDWFMRVNVWSDENHPLREVLAKAKAEAKGGIVRGYVRRGFYTEQVQGYLDRFGPTQVRIMIFEELIRDPKPMTEETLRFLGVTLDGLQVKNYRAYNQSNRSLAKSNFASRLLNSPKTRRLARSRLVKPLLAKELTKPKLEPVERKLMEDLYREDAIKLSELLQRQLPWKWMYE